MLNFAAMNILPNAKEVLNAYVDLAAEGETNKPIRMAQYELLAKDIMANDLLAVMVKAAQQIGGPGIFMDGILIGMLIASNGRTMNAKP